MSVIKVAADICRGAEIALRDLMRKAISAAEYRHLPTLAKMTEQIAALASRAGQSAEATPEPALPPVATLSTRAHKLNPRVSKPQAGAKKRKPRTQSRVRTTGGWYPKFHRSDDMLVKVGWSKKAKNEYEHRAPNPYFSPK